MVREITGGGGGGGGGFNIKAPTQDFVQKETAEEVQIHPDERKTVLEVPLDPAALWYEVGTKDHTYSKYHYKVNGNEIFDQEMIEPLGLYNSPYRYPQPIVAENSLSVEVSRDPDGPGPAKYFSKVRIVPISEAMANRFKTAMKSLL